MESARPPEIARSEIEPDEIEPDPIEPDEMRAAEEIRAAVEQMCRGDGLRSVAQPIVRLTDMTVVGYEALTRVDDPRGRSIQWWLDRATESGLRSPFEVACWRTIAQIPDVPDRELPEDCLLFAKRQPADAPRAGALATAGDDARPARHRADRADRGRRLSGSARRARAVARERRAHRDR